MTKERFTGKDNIDLDRQIWDWLSQHPGWRIAKRHAVERLPLQMMSPHPIKFIEAPDAVAVCIEFEFNSDSD